VVQIAREETYNRFAKGKMVFCTALLTFIDG